MVFSWYLSFVFRSSFRSSVQVKDNSYWRQNETSFVMTGISFFFPTCFEILGLLEKYHPRKQLRWQLGRYIQIGLIKHWEHSRIMKISIPYFQNYAVEFVKSVLVDYCSIQENILNEWWIGWFASLQRNGRKYDQCNRCTEWSNRIERNEWFTFTWFVIRWLEHSGTVFGSNSHLWHTSCRN